MYCKKCGCKIKSGQRCCSDCGIETSNIEYCGGFWGLVGEDNKKEHVPIIEEIHPQKNQDNEKQDILVVKEKYKKGQNRKKRKLLNYVIFVLLTICVIQTVRISVVSHKYEKQQVRYRLLSEKYKNAEDEIKRLSEMIDNFDIKEMQEEVSVEESDIVKKETPHEIHRKTYIME